MSLTFYKRNLWKIFFVHKMYKWVNAIQVFYWKRNEINALKWSLVLPIFFLFFSCYGFKAEKYVLPELPFSKVATIYGKKSSMKKGEEKILISEIDGKVIGVITGAFEINVTPGIHAIKFTLQIKGYYTPGDVDGAFFETCIDAKEGHRYQIYSKFDETQSGFPFGKGRGTVWIKDLRTKESFAIYHTKYTKPSFACTEPYRTKKTDKQAKVVLKKEQQTDTPQDKSQKTEYHFLVSRNHCNLLSGSNISNSVVAELKRGTKLIYLGKRELNYFYVQTRNGKNGTCQR